MKFHAIFVFLILLAFMVRYPVHGQQKQISEQENTIKFSFSKDDFPVVDGENFSGAVFHYVEEMDQVIAHGVATPSWRWFVAGNLDDDRENLFIIFHFKSSLFTPIKMQYRDLNFSYDGVVQRLIFPHRLSENNKKRDQTPIRNFQGEFVSQLGTTKYLAFDLERRPCSIFKVRAKSSMQNQSLPDVHNLIWGFFCLAYPEKITEGLVKNFIKAIGIKGIAAPDLIKFDISQKKEIITASEVDRERQKKQAAIQRAKAKELEARRIREAKAREQKKLEQAELKRKTDALEAIAKREAERKEKAKRLAEANKIKNPDAIAVIIGNRDYEGSTPDVDFAGNDADAMKAYVLNTLGYRPGNVIDLRDASKAKLEDAFGTKENHKGRLYDYVRADESDVIVFYSGHGVPGMSDKRGYLLAVDANPNRAELTGYPVDILLKNLAKVPAKSMMVFIDACFSGDSPKGMLVRATSGLTVKITAPKKASDNMIVITAAEGDQFASWDEDAKHGLFTKYLLEALNGAADRHAKTGNKDGKVTLGEVKAYLDREMTYQARRRFSRDQHATVSGDLKTVLSSY
ncbi:caspase family protein [Rhodospirillaceae bacterium]|nr:caspase family protein [Rhodospirillaceae bacterium]